MREAADPLVLDFVEWIAREPRVYSEVVATWKTSCPRLTIWEDAVDQGYVTRETLTAFYTDTLEALVAFADGAPIRVANPDALAHARQRRSS